MNSQTYAKRPAKAKISTEQTRVSQTRLQNVKSEQNLLQKTVDETKIQQYLIKQIQQARVIIQNYKNSIQDHRNQRNLPASKDQWVKLLCEKQRLIQIKNIEINNINQEIKILKSFPKQAYKDQIKKYNTVKNLQFFKLSDQIISQKEELILLQKEHRRKKQQLQRNKGIMKQALEKFNNFAGSNSKRLMSYEQFINKQRSKIKEDVGLRTKKYSKKNIPPSKQSMELDENHKKNMMNFNELKDVENKKNIAESALKVLKKKHQTEINELNAKLQFLTDENEYLILKLKQRQQQLKSAELRFSQAKQVPPTKKSSRANRYSQPEL